MYRDEPTPRELERYHAEARRLRRQYLGSLMQAFFAKLKTVFSRAARSRRRDAFLERGMMPRR